MKGAPIRSSPTGCWPELNPLLGTRRLELRYGSEMIRLLFLYILLLWPAACDSIPADPDGTLNKVRAERTFRAGLISSGSDRAAGAEEKRFLHRVAAATGARPILTEGAAESLLLDLEEGELDLVIGPVGPDSPWKKRVAILHPLGETLEPPRLVIVPIARNGENRWIMLLEREARAVRAGS